MPELPEVETVVGDLNRKIRGEKILKVWLDTPNQIRAAEKPSQRLPAKSRQAKIIAEKFKKILINRRILGARRRGKNILLDLSGQKTILIHQKMTGHLLFGQWQIKGKQVFPIAPREVVNDKYNGYIHLIMFLSSGYQLALSDVRKFAKAMVADTSVIESLDEIRLLGPDAANLKFSLSNFIKQLHSAGPTIKQALMNPRVIAGIGNIYSDDILWRAKIHPLIKPRNLNKQEMRRIYVAMREVLQKAIKLRGTSISDFRDTGGRPGKYAEYRYVYQRTGEPCQHCQKPIKRIKVGGRSTHFCLNCQKPRYL